MLDDPKGITDRHTQKHIMSCATSLGELLVKLEGEIPPDLQRYEPALVSTGLFHLKDKTYGRLTIRQHIGDAGDLVARELPANRAFGLFIKNTYWNPAGIGIHGWAVVAIEDIGGEPHLRLYAKDSEKGHGEGRNTLTHTIKVSELNTVPITDAIFYELAP